MLHNAVVASKSIDVQKRREIAALAQCDERTVRRWTQGKPMKESVRLRVEAAAKKLKFVK
jgi:DNA-binding LacI/PurR family transcriptional regulator